jgi:hypothetical protein
MLGGDRELIRDMERDLTDLGFSDSLSSGEVSWADVSPAESFAGTGDQRPTRDVPVDDRVALWQAVNERMTPQAATAFLLAVLGSSLERESTAAASALWRQISTIDPKHSPLRYWQRYGWEWWYELRELGPLEADGWPLPGALSGLPDFNIDVDGFEATEWNQELWNLIYERAVRRLRDRDGGIAYVGYLTLFRLNGALRSPDPIVRSLASAAFMPSSDSDLANAPPPDTRGKAQPETLVSTMIHGTWAYRADWWQPEGDFFEFIRQPYRPNLYAGGARFDWNDRWSKRHRKDAGDRFRGWAEDRNVAPTGLQTVFGHSFGGEIAARAVNANARIKELVLMSVPVTTHVEAAAESGLPVVDIRLKCDPVLVLARLRNRLKQSMKERENVTPVIFDNWTLDHGASHKPDAWQREDVARKGGIQALP